MARCRRVGFCCRLPSLVNRLINAETGKVGTHTNLICYPDDQELTHSLATTSVRHSRRAQRGCPCSARSVVPKCAAGAPACRSNECIRITSPADAIFSITWSEIPSISSTRSWNRAIRAAGSPAVHRSRRCGCRCRDFRSCAPRTPCRGGFSENHLCTRRCDPLRMFAPPQRGPRSVSIACTFTPQGGNSRPA